jgi:hypothetical protein
VGVCESFAGRSGTGWQQRKRFAGSRVNEKNWSIDGTSFSDVVDNTQTGPLANDIESFQEVHIDLSNNSAEFASIGQVTIISKSRTNEFHATGFHYYSTPWFRARSSCLAAADRNPALPGSGRRRAGIHSQNLWREEPDVLILFVRKYPR